MPGLLNSNPFSSFTKKQDKKIGSQEQEQIVSNGSINKNKINDVNSVNSPVVKGIFELCSYLQLPL
jgi:hypothetical protein